MGRIGQKGLVAVCLLAASHLVLAQAAMPSMFSRKSVSPAERRATTEVEQANTESDQEAGKSPSSGGASASRIKTATPANAETVLRSALASVNTGMTEVVIRTSDWDKGRAPEERARGAADGDQAGDKRNGKSSATARPHKQGPGARWGYGVANGPAAWGYLSPEFRACNIGRMQSPVDIWSSRTVLSPEPKLGFSYSAVGARMITLPGGQLKLQTHAGSFMTHRGEAYYLESIQFRLPGEGRVDGIAPVMSVYLHHRSAEGKFAIVSVPVQVTQEHNEAIERVWSLFGKRAGGAVTIEPSHLLPEHRGHFHYMGSLTQPPCTEGVAWFVMREPITMTRQQFTTYSRAFEPNARPVQKRESEAVISFAP